jgi:hypothetical protein
MEQRGRRTNTAGAMFDQFVLRLLGSAGRGGNNGDKSVEPANAEFQDVSGRKSRSGRKSLSGWRCLVERL